MSKPGMRTPFILQGILPSAGQPVDTNSSMTADPRLAHCGHQTDRRQGQSTTGQKTSVRHVAGSGSVRDG